MYGQAIFEELISSIEVGKEMGFQEEALEENWTSSWEISEEEIEVLNTYFKPSSLYTIFLETCFNANLHFCCSATL